MYLFPSLPPIRNLWLAVADRSSHFGEERDFFHSQKLYTLHRLLQPGLMTTVVLHQCWLQTQPKYCKAFLEKCNIKCALFCASLYFLLFMTRKPRSIRYYFCSPSLTVLKRHCFMHTLSSAHWILSPTLGTVFSLDMAVTRHGNVKGRSSSGGLAWAELTHSIKINQLANPITFIQQKLLHFAALHPDLCPLMRTTCWARRFSICWKKKATTFAKRTLTTTWKP